MTAEEVFDALSTYLYDDGGSQSINLWDASQDEVLTGMQPVLALFGIDAGYVWTNAILAMASDNKGVILKGNGFFSEQLTSPDDGTYAAKGSLYFREDGDAYEIILDLLDAFEFSTFFSNLPDTRMLNPDESPGVRWYPSIMQYFSVDNGSFSGVTGGTELIVKGALPEPTYRYFLEKTPYIGPYPLSLEGTLELPLPERTYPIFNLDARGNTNAISASSEAGVPGPSAFKIEDPAITLVSAKLDPPEETIDSYSTINLFGDFNFGEIKGRVSTLIMSTGDVWNFSVVFDPETSSLVQGLGQLTAFFGVELPIPMNFPVLSDFYIAEIDLVLNNTSDNPQLPSFSILNVSMTIRSDKLWNPPIPFVSFSNVGTRWVWGWSKVFDEEKKVERKTYMLTGSVFGTLNLGDADGGTSAPVPSGSGSPSGGVGELAEVTQDPIKVNMNMSIPDFIIKGSMAPESFISITDALYFFFKNSGPPTGSQQMNITQLAFSADPIGQNYSAQAAILFGDPRSPDKEQGWVIDLVVLEIILRELSFFVNVNAGRVSGGINGTLFLNQAVQAEVPEYELPRIDLSAEYPLQNPDEPQGWILAGQLYPGTKISLTDLVYQFIYGDEGSRPDNLPSLDVDRLYVEFTTGSGDRGASYIFGGTISAQWQPEIFNTKLKITASASLDMQKEADKDKASGKLMGAFSVNKIALEVSMQFGVPEPTYSLKVQFDNLWLLATTAWRGEQAKRHQVVTLQLGGVTLGDILEYLVNLAEPTLGFTLDSPWDILKKIDLSRFTLTIDPTDNVVEFVFKTNVDLVVAKLDSVGVKYSKSGPKGKVELMVTGQFLGEEYPPEKPLAWDVVNDPPPSVPGQGKSLVDLSYLGIGQHVTIDGTYPDTVAGSVKLLKDAMTPPDPAAGNPLPSTMKYSAESQWLIGLDVKLMDTVSLGFIFNDPVLYGLSIALSGERAGALAGLKFEILYKKITDDIGMFRVEFQVPDMFRTIQLGAVTITLGIIVVEIYTNGNFKVDLGFPYNRNFERSFSLQAGIFIGRGGFYLGVLNGDTSTQVPKITNGNFSPVIELGIGIAAGIGREIRAGILSGGAYIQLEVIFEGVLAFFNPNSNGVAPARFFKAKGIAALHGKVYGAVDFKVIKVSVTLEAYAMVSLTYESYQPMLIEMLVRVTARASIKILFVRIHFSFSVKLSFSFKVGSAKPTPWILAASGSGTNTNNVGARMRGLVDSTPQRSVESASYAAANRSRRSQALRNAFMEGQATMMKTAARGARVESVSVEDMYLLNWDPSEKVFPDAPLHAHMTLLPMFTIGDMPIEWGTEVPENPSPQYRSAFVLFADTGMNPNAKTEADLRVRSAAHSATTTGDDDTSMLAADILVKGLSLYAINAIPSIEGQEGVVTAGQLDFLIEQMDLPETEQTGFSATSLQTFFQTNINLWISGDPGGSITDMSAMVVPMLPDFSWTSPQAGPVDFSSYNKIGPLYEWGIAQMMNAYFSMGEGEQEKPENDDPANYESFASFLFRDFCLMLTQNAVQEMQKRMDNTIVKVGSEGGVARALNQIAQGLPKATVPYVIHSGDTLGSVAESLGASVLELEFLNPGLEEELRTGDVGDSISVIIGVAPEVLAIDNPEINFAVKQVALGNLVHPAASGDTLSSIGTLFQVNDVADMLRFESLEYPILRKNASILQRGATFDLAEQTFNNAPADYDQARTAGVFFTRYIDLFNIDSPTLHFMANWYAQAIAENKANQAILESIMPSGTILEDVELIPGQMLNVPVGYNNLEGIDDHKYTTANGDTLTRIGYALALSQDFTTSNPENVDGWQAFEQAVASNGANSWKIPAQTGIAIVQGENIEMLVRRLIIDATWNPAGEGQPILGAWTYNWDAVSVWIGAAKVLQPLAPVTVPGAETGVHDTLNFNVITQVYGLTITDAATRLKATVLYAEDQELNVKLLPAQNIETLINEILVGDSFATIVNQSSRMFMSGLQLPNLEEEDGHIVPDTNDPKPLYDLTGQQFNVAVNPEEPDEVALELDVTSQQPWITLMDSITVTADDTLDGLEEQYPDLLVYNPGLNEDNFKVGMVLLTQPTASTLDYSYTNAAIVANGPGTGLAVEPVPAEPPAPSPLALSAVVLKNYGLQHSIVLQSPVELPIPIPEGTSNVSGNPTLWKFPAELLQKAVTGSTAAYEILGTKEDDQVNENTKAIENSTYGMLLPFKVKRLENDSNKSFALIGVDTEDRNQLIALIEWLSTPKVKDTTKAYTLLAPAPNASNTNGLTVLDSSAEDTYLIKSNLSTESVPPQALNRGARMLLEENDALYYASMDELSDFATLLWQGSVVGGIGYYFGLKQEIPGSAFDEQGNITLQLLVIAGTQQDVASEGRTLLPFNNCALLGASVDSSLKSIFMESYDPTAEGETTVQSIVPPGNVGFEFLTPNPESQDDPTNPLVRALDLYSLMSFAIPEITGSNFFAPPSGMPVVPAPSDGSKKTSAEKLKEMRVRGTDELDEVLPYRKYEQLLPVKNFVKSGTTNAAPDVSGLPTQGNNPYYGFGASSTLPEANFVFGFGDVLGNRTGNNPENEGETPIKVGYTDNLVGLAEWPSLARVYSVHKVDQNAELTVTLSYRSSESLPTPSQSGSVNLDALGQQLNQYENIYYQMVQPGLNAWIVTSLKLIEDADYGNKGTEVADFDQLWKFAAGAYANTKSILDLSPAKPTLAKSLGDIESVYNIRPVETALANEDTSMEDLFGETIPTVPAYYPYAENVSMEKLYSMLPNGWPKELTIEQVWEQFNNDLPLKEGILLNITQDAVTTGSVNPTPSLADIASSVHTDAVEMAVLNEEQPVLENGYVFVVEVDEGVEVTVTVDDSTNTFVSVMQAFSAQGVQLSVSDLALYVMDDEGVFAPDKTLDYVYYVTKEGDTIETNDSKDSMSTLIDLNTSTLNVYDPGALVHFDKFSGVSYSATVPSLKDFADRYACPPELLITANADFVLPKGTGMVLAGTLSWPEDVKSMRAAYTLQGTDTIDGVAALFEPLVNKDDYPNEGDFETANATAFVNLNANMPGTLIPGNTLNISVGGTNYPVETASSNASFAALLTSLQAQNPAGTMEDIVKSVGGNQGVLLAGGLFMCTPVRFALNSTPVEVAAQYGVSAGSFALANVAMQGVIAGGVDLTFPDSTVIITTSANDTFNSLITRCATHGIAVDANEIVDANPNAAIYVEGGNALLPPAEVRFDADLEQGGPYASPIIPLDVSLRIIRPQDLIYPDFVTAKHTGPVEMIESAIPAPTKNSDGDNGLSFNQFIKDFVNALEDLRIGTGQVEGIEQDLWCVNFNQQGIANVELTGPVLYEHQVKGEEKDVRQPRFFALKPLYKNLVTRSDIEIRPLEETGLLGEPTFVSYQNIDVEVWARRFVQDLDQFLTGSYAVTLYNDTVMREQLGRVLGYKESLIPSIAGGLDVILAAQNKDKEVPLSDASKAFEQQLGVSLSRTYGTTAVIQYESVADSAWQTDSGLLPAALYGGGSIDTEIPGISMVSAKTDVEKDPDGYVNFLMTLEKPELHRSVGGAFKYDISHVEFNIRSTPIPGDYKASDWLTFTPLLSGTYKPTALENTDFPYVEVPIPLRLFPESPLIQQQLADPQVKKTEDSIDQLAQWKYGVNYTHQYASQDFVVLIAEFNLHLQLSAKRVMMNRDLFTELAQYIAVADALWNDLKALSDPEVQVDLDVLRNAVTTFADLVENVSDYWTKRIESTSSAAADDKYQASENDRYQFNTRVTYDEEKGTFEKFSLIPLTQGKYGPNGTPPDMYLKDSLGVYRKLVQGPGILTEVTYTLPEDFGTPPGTWPDLRIEWGELNLANVQNARIKMWVERNQSLLNNLLTNKEFIFTTDLITAPSIVTPLNVYGKRFDINDQGATLAEALNNTFTTLFGTDKVGQQVTMELSYGYELVKGSKHASEGLVTYLPIGLYPNQTLSDQTGEQLSEIIAGWEADNKPNPEGGEWVFSLKLYSQLTPTPQTLLVIDHLVYLIEE